MNNLLLITDALDFIETNLTEDVKTDDIANSLFCSKSTLEKLFRYTTGMSIKEYSVRRRMSKAAKDLRLDPSASLLDIAVKYGYGSNEAFTRAFKSIWFVTPSEYRKNPKYYELFPAIKLEQELMEDNKMRSRKKVDISELYDYIKNRRNCYFVGVDINSLIPINDISIEAGDIAIITALNRIEDAAGEDDIVFRIGGDEFVALTSSEDSEYANEIAKKILSHNGEAFNWNGKDIPLKLYVTTYKIEAESLRYAELFSTMQQKLQDVKGQN